MRDFPLDRVMRSMKNYDLWRDFPARSIAITPAIRGQKIVYREEVRMKSDLRNKLLIVASSFAVATSLSSMSLAQEADADAEASAENERQLDVVTVHGQRKEQTILEVPISASVFTDDLIDTANVQEADDYLLQTPNVTFSKSGRNGAREIVIAIRGVSDVRGGEKVNSISAFATYFDELGLAQLSSGQANPPTYDVESIEVLRGPQGVFFGRNSEGGAINIRTKKPEQDFYGRIDAGMGSFNTFELAGVVNGGITDTLSGRLTVQATTTDGPLENRHPTGVIPVMIIWRCAANCAGSLRMQRQ